METLSAYQRTAALAAAIELDLFTAIAEGHSTPTAIAARLHAAERGVRILCDYLVVIGHLRRRGDAYRLTEDSSAFLDLKSPHCINAVTGFLCAPFVMDSFRGLAENVRRGGASEQGSALSPEHPIWVKFARSMAPLLEVPARLTAELLKKERIPSRSILDIAAGHGLFGVALARLNPDARVAAMDWPRVLDVALETAKSAGVEERYRLIPGNALEADFGAGYDLILLANFLHHFDPAAIVALLMKIRRALIPGGRAVILEFVPNEDRVTPARAAAFSIVMLASTPAGQAYTHSEYRDMLRKAGFQKTTLHPLLPTPESVILAE